MVQIAPNQFEVRLDGLGGLIQRVLGAAPAAIDPYLVGRAISEVMRLCSVRSAAGQRLLWNEYRVILARADFAHLAALEGYLQRDLSGVLAAEAQRLGGELVGDLCVHVIADEADELEAGRAVVRVGFAPTAELQAPQRGEMTVRLGAIAGVIASGPAGPEPTLDVAEAVQLDPALSTPYHLEWSGGSAPLQLGIRAIAGRPHPGAPADFVPLTGAPTTINKRQLWVMPMSARAVVGRLQGANPVHVDGASLASGSERELAGSEVEISLSRGALILRLRRVA